MMMKSLFEFALIFTGVLSGAYAHSTSPSAIILTATGSMSGTLNSNTFDKDYAWIPLPLDYATQVPLDVQIKVTPQNIVKNISYISDDIGNWGAMIHLVDNIPTNIQMTFQWHVVVLTKYVSDSERSRYYNKPITPGEWLSASAIVQSQDSFIKDASTQAVAGKTDVFNKVLGIVDWTSQNIKYKFHPELDASSALKYRETTCTGYANLAAALGRAAGVPAVTLAGYLVGQPQETHWINEFYINPDVGWRRVEPEVPAQYQNKIEEDYIIPVRIDRLADEYIWQYTRGIPHLSYPVSPVLGMPQVVPKKGAQMVSNNTDAEQLFFDLRNQWQKDFSILQMTGIISKERESVRQQFEGVSSFDELKLLAKQLKSVH